MKKINAMDFFSKIGFNPKLVFQQFGIGILLILIFGFCFGIHYVILSIAFIIGTFYFTTRNFAVKPFQKFITILFIYIAIAILGTLACINSFYGLLLNFITIFLIVFCFVSNYKTSLYYPIIFYLTYIEVFPAPLHELPIRILATFVGVVYMVGTQLLLFRKSLDKSLNKLIKSSISLTIEQTDNLLQGKYDENNYKNNQKLFKQINNKVYSTRYGNYFTNNIGKSYFNWMVANQALNNILKNVYNLNKKKDDKYFNEFIVELNKLLKYIRDYFNKDISFKNLNLMTNDFVIKYEDAPVNYYVILQVVQIIKLNNVNINRYVNMEDTKKNSFRDAWLLPEKYSSFNSLKINFNLNSIKFRFAFRLAFVLSLSLFIFNYLKMPKLCWIPITVMTVTQPFFEDTFSKAWLRFKGTIIGSIALFILFSFPLSTTSKIVISIICIILSFGFVEHDKMVILSTIASVIFASLTLGGYVPIIYKVTYVTVGVIISILANNFLFPYKIDDAIYNYTNKLIDLDIDLVNAVTSNMSGERNLDMIRALITYSHLISDKLDFYNTKLEREEINEFIVYNSTLVNNMLYSLFYYNECKNLLKVNDLNKFKDYFIYLLNQIKYKKNTKIIRETLSAELSDLFNKVELKNNKVLVINVLNTFTITKYLDEIYGKI